MTRRVLVVDYGMGNLHSVAKALVRAGGAVRVSGDASEVAQCDCLVLPGVGAFKDAMNQLKSQELVEPIRSHIRAGKPFLGICLGYQLLFDVSYEDGEATGLGIFRGKVDRFPRQDAAGASVKIPQIGWNQLEILKPEPFFVGIPSGAYVYFVHSYFPVPSDETLVATRTEYAGVFASAVARENLLAVQFHPEKSQRVGLRILQNFLGA